MPIMQTAINETEVPYFDTNRTEVCDVAKGLL